SEGTTTPTNNPSGQASRYDPMLHASSSNNHSLFSFRRNGGAGDVADTNSSSSFDFLPSVSFDDLQTSIESASTEFKLTQFPSPSGQGTILHDRPLLDSMAGHQPNASQNGGTTRVAAQPSTSSTTTTGRPGRSGSILTRPSTSGRQVSNGSIASVSSSVPDAPTAPAAMRNRRQNHYPPVSNSNFIKAPRKSIGTGSIEVDYGSKGAHKRRPSLMSNASDKEKGTADTTRGRMDTSGGQYGDNIRSASTSRATKARSVQPPPRTTANFTSNVGSNNGLNPDKTARTSTAFPRSPKSGTKGTPPNANKRMSVMPGPHTSHVSGLGARTISPTDAQRMKRMSAHPQVLAQQMADAPPPPIDSRPASRSPSMIPRMTSTPSSLRTTPEVSNRKSYSSGLSVNSTTSFNTHRTSTGSMQRTLGQAGPSSRLPAPKTLNVNNPPPAEEEEDVPPVPAIPKAYESPKDSPAELSWLDKRKSNYAADSSSLRSNSTGTSSNTPSQEPLNKTPKTIFRKHAPRKTVAGSSSDLEQKPAPGASRNNLQPLRLPPLNLGPLSTPTAAKIAALPDQGYEDGKISPRILAKTPTTPMTASKTTFFGRGHGDRDTDKPILRSSSSVHHRKKLTTPSVDPTSSSESLLDAARKTPTRKPTVSPFLFDSLMTKSKTTGDVNKSLTRKPTGPRAPKLAKPANKSPPPIPSQEEPPEEPQTPSSMTTLRRKLSLSWKRSNSKSSHHASNNSDSMPPPKLPASASMNLNNAKSSSPSHTTKSSTNYLETRRRKSSSRAESSTTTSQPRGSSLQKILRPRPSIATVRAPEPYTAEMDRDDYLAEEEMKKLGSRRKETELAARTLDALRKRASPKERVGPHDAIRIAMLNIYEKGEIVDYNDIYFCGTQNAHKVVGDLNSSQPNFGYDDERGDYAIVIVDVLGKGSFGQVVRCIDHKTGVLVAALVENRHSMVNFTHSFYFRGHLCISTELLDMNLYEFIKANSFRGSSLKLQHKVIHCDLKPENILIRHPLHSEIKKVYTYIQSRFYRSPEVILGMTYGLPIDMWSVGCILAELYTGEQLACIMEIFGPPEKHLIEKSTRKKLFFDSMGKPRLTTLQQALKCEDEPFLDFLARCLRWDPDRRLKPEEAIRHEVRDGSPMKRTNTIGAPRPLPEPPGSATKSGITIRPRDASNSSPHKAVGPKARTSTGGSSLPRVAGRTASGKQDLASAGANAAMGRRA
ncbi:hypothetical protein F4780DRAFT_761325, partial [Xylariomycetidae sp. FL0641]